jgi:hypothetical protein
MDFSLGEPKENAEESQLCGHNKSESSVKCMKHFNGDSWLCSQCHPSLEQDPTEVLFSPTIKQAAIVFRKSENEFINLISRDQCGREGPF